MLLQALYCNHKEFANQILPSLLQVFQKESSKKIFLLGHFEIDLSKYENTEPVNNCVNIL